jgi:hypothetical protein
MAIVSLFTLTVALYFMFVVGFVAGILNDPPPRKDDKNERTD